MNQKAKFWQINLRVIISIILAFIIFQVFLFFICMQYISDNLSFIVSIFYAFYLSFIFFLMLKNNQVSKYRKLFFIPWAILFCIAFISELIEVRKSMFLYDEDIKNLRVPMCHIVIFMTVVPAVFKKLLIFPTPLVATPPYGFYPMLFIWIMATLAIGRGFCSFLCFFGGWDELFSRITKKPKLELNIRKFRLFPFFFCGALIILSYLFLKPFYCIWFCPFKAVTEFPAPNTLLRILQTVIFILLFLSLVIILPILTKKRTQCGIFCPFGAFQSLVGMINIYRIKKDKDKCKFCNSCEKACPVYAIDDKGVKFTCTRCGSCIDICPQSAIDYNFIGSLTYKVGLLSPKTLFLFTAIIFFGIFSSGFAINGIIRIIYLFQKIFIIW